MALVLKDRVQETATPNTTVSFTCGGAITGFQAFSVIGNGNTTFYTAVDGSGNWESGLGTYTTAGNLVTRTTILASSNAGSAVTFSGAVSLFVNYPATKSVNLDASGNVSALGTVASGTWQGSTVGVAYGGTGVTASTGANSVVLRDANENIIVNSVTQELTSTISSATITTLTPASSHFQVLTGTTTQTYKLPDATSLPTGSTWIFDNDSTGNLTITDNAGATVDVVAAGGYSTVFLEANGTVGGEWGRFGMVPSEVNWGTNSLNLGGLTVITNGTWNGATIAYNYGGTGLTSFAAANNALYSTSASALTAGTLPVLAGGTGVTTSTGSGSTVLSTSPTLVSPALGTPASGTLTNCTFPTLNQNTTGTASNITAYTINQNVGTANAVQHSDITTARAAALTTGYIYYGNTGTKYAGFDGTNFVSSMPMSFNILGSSASCTGNAATATTATNQSGGTVSATTGSFSGTTSFPSATGAFNIQNGTGDGASFTVYNTAIHSHWGIGFRDYQDLTTVKAYIDCRSGNIGTSGAFVGNVTGNVTGSSTSCTGNAATSSSCTGNAASATYAPLISGTAYTVSTAVATISFTGIPTWAKRIIINMAGLDTTAAGIPAVRAGAGTYEATGYSGVTSKIGATTVDSGASATTSWDLMNSAASTYIYSGRVVISLISGTLYTITGTYTYSGTTNMMVNGYKTFSGLITQLQLLMQTGTDTFSGGTVNITWE